MSDYNNSMPDRCPQCGGDLFRAVPGKTTEEEILEYKRCRVDSIGPIQWDPAWIPDGAYCYRCNWSALSNEKWA